MHMPRLAVGFAELLTSEVFERLRSVIDPADEGDPRLRRTLPGREPLGPVRAVHQDHGGGLAPGPAGARVALAKCSAECFHVSRVRPVRG